MTTTDSNYTATDYLRSRLQAAEKELREAQAIEYRARPAFEAAKAVYDPLAERAKRASEQVKRLREEIEDLAKPEPLTWQAVRGILKRAGITLAADAGLFSRSAGASVRRYDDRTVEVSYSPRGTFGQDRPDDMLRTQRAMNDIRKAFTEAGLVVKDTMTSWGEPRTSLIYVQRPTPPATSA